MLVPWKNLFILGCYDAPALPKKKKVGGASAPFGQAVG
jgi:hypothetical protein